MEKFTVIKNEHPLVVPLYTGKNLFTLADFFAPYGANTKPVFTRFLDQLYRQYKTTEAYRALSFGEQADVDFNHFVLRKFIQDLER